MDLLHDANLFSVRKAVVVKDLAGPEAKVFLLVLPLCKIKPPLSDFISVKNKVMGMLATF
jgi:hypothetical protein